MAQWLVVEPVQDEDVCALHNATSLLGVRRNRRLPWGEASLKRALNEVDGGPPLQVLLQVLLAHAVEHAVRGHTRDPSSPKSGGHQCQEPGPGVQGEDVRPWLSL